MKNLINLICMTAMIFSSSVYAGRNSNSHSGMSAQNIGYGPDGSKHFICNNNSIDASAQAVQFIENWISDMHSKDCMPLRTETYELNPKTCERLVACRQLISTALPNMKAYDNSLNAAIASDYAKEMFKENSPKIDRLEDMRSYAESKFGESFGSNCPSKTEYTGSATCSSEIISFGYNRYHVNCKADDKGCYNEASSKKLGILSYKDYWEKERGQEYENGKKKNNVTREYSKYRRGKYYEVTNRNDGAYYKKLFDFISSDEFKGYSAIDKKGELIIKLNEINNDPILKVDLGLDKDRVPNGEALTNLIQFVEGKFTSPRDFSDQFNKYRRARVEAIFAQGNACKETISYAQICEEVTLLNNDEVLKKDPALVKKFTTEVKINDPELEKKLNPNYTQDYATLLNAKRCISFNLLKDDYTRGSCRTSWSGSGYNDTVGSGPSSGSQSGNSGGDSYYRVSESMSTTTSIKKSKGEEVAEQVAIAMGGNNQVNPKNSAELAIPYVPTAQNEKTENDKSAKSENDDENEDDFISSMNDKGNFAASAKMDELLKKLAAAEEKVDKMKADSEAAEDAREKQKKIDDENALIKELKNQISDLKSQNNAKETSRAAASVEPPKATPPTSSSSGGVIGSSRGDSSSPKDNFAKSSAGGSSGAAGGGAQSGSAGVAGKPIGAILTSTSAGSAEGRNITLASGLVVTTLDGLSSEKVAQTISNRIKELKGVPFYIEEDGFVKEVVPLMKDGKVLLDDKGNPIFEKITKGKIGDKAFAKKGDKKRVPANITNNADLKRDQEEKLKRERAEYLKLKNLTNGVINGK